MSTTIGRRAEQAAAEYLESHGFKVLDMNWRRTNCEIDIVARKLRKLSRFRSEKVIYFIEVKYRKNSQHGSGLDYFTPNKLNQMQFAAEMWVIENHWEGDYDLGAIEVSGKEYRIGEFIQHVES